MFLTKELSAVVWKSFYPLPVFIYLYICHIWMIQIKQMLIFHKDNLSKYKMPFWNNDLIYKEESCKLAWTYVKNVLPPKSNN